MCNAAAFNRAIDFTEEQTGKTNLPRFDSEDGNRQARIRTPGDLLPPNPNPFAVFGPRIGVDRTSGVAPGKRGKRTSVSDLKIGR